MATIRDLRVKIRSIESIKKITKAMEMVAAARLKKAQERLEEGRPYAKKIAEVTLDLAAMTTWSFNPLFRPHQRKERALVLIFTGDRGLAGGFHQKIADGSLQFQHKLEERVKEVALYMIGFKGYQRFQTRKHPLYKRYEGAVAGSGYSAAQALAKEINELYLKEEFDEVYLYYAKFHSPMEQRTRAFKLLPVDPGLKTGNRDRGLFLFEPSSREILEGLLLRYIESEIYRAFLETEAGELGARMTAMSSATDNATELIDRYRLAYNKLRQSKITTEIAEIVGGAEALKG